MGLWVLGRLIHGGDFSKTTWVWEDLHHRHKQKYPHRFPWIIIFWFISARFSPTLSLLRLYLKQYRGSDGKESTCQRRRLGSIPASGRSPGGGNGNLLQYSCLENSMDREPGGLQTMGSQRVRHYWATNTFTFKELLKPMKTQCW